MDSKTNSGEQTFPLSYSLFSGSDTGPLLQKTIGDSFDETVANHPNALALAVDHQKVSMTYSEYQQAINALAVGLLNSGISRGDRVGIWSPNCLEWCLTQFATAKIGAILVCINPAYRPYELEYALNKVECKALITAESFKTSNYLAMLEQLAPELAYCEPGALASEKLPHLHQIIRMGDELSAGMYNFSELCKTPAPERLAELAAVQASLDYREAINIQFTSGTTGSPKGATLSHYNVLNNGKIVGDGMRLTQEDRLCIPVPLYHCFGMVMGNLACITHSSAAIFPGESFEPESTLRVVSEQRCTALHGVPTMFVAFLTYPHFDSFDFSSLRTGIMAGALCPAEVMNSVIEKMHMRDVLIAYGQTETSPVNHMTTDTDLIEKRVATVGRPGPHLEVKLIDGQGEVVLTGNKGEICCRGYAVMRGYWNDAEQTHATIDVDGWLHSGDLGVMDELGYVKVVGRIKDMIIRGGENIYPREVEEFLYTHPKVQEVQVFGIPDEKYGEKVCAWIALTDEHAVSDDDIKAYCRENITYFKVPEHIRFVTEFPMTVTGKIQKFKMRESTVSELEADLQTNHTG